MTDTAPTPQHIHQMRSSRGSATTAPTKPAMAAPFLSPQLVSTPQTHHLPSQQSSSPNYFGYQGEGSSFASDSPRHVKNNWSPPSSTVRSTVAASPTFVPVDQNPDYDAFRRQSDHNSKSINIGGLSGFKMGMPAPRPNFERTLSVRTPGSQTHKSRPSETKDVPVAPAHRVHLEPNQSELSRSPKRTLSPGALQSANRRGSPPSYSDGGVPPTSSSHSSPADSVPRFELPLDQFAGVGVAGSLKPRSKTLLEGKDTAAQVFIAPERLVNLLDSSEDSIMVLDLRISTQYAISHITSALSLCLPTTLLKRPSFDVKKLADTFQDEEERRRFENWRQYTTIVVYDASSMALKDATTCLNTIKKFRTENFEGSLFIIEGGFAAFSRRFPAYVVDGVDSRAAQGAVDESGRPRVAPVVGGCPMPGTDAPANPFFGNIRQNMDLIGGVGQIPLKHPTNATTPLEAEFPAWLKKASENQDQGKIVSSKFERIERQEKKRMEEALSGNVSIGAPTCNGSPDSGVQIAGLEKGNKNRYNNIWPFEHSRVRLQGVSQSGCDYFNASHIKASRSNKSYISTQAPIPATFNDFWNVVWQQDVRVIVMLTAEKEGAQVKAHNYWSEKQYGHLHLDFLSEKRASLELARIHKHQRRSSGTTRRSTLTAASPAPVTPQDTQASSTTDETSQSQQPYVTVRKFTLKHDRHPFEPMREITQLHYSGWPDFGAPAHPAHLLGLVEQCAAVSRAANARTRGPEEPESPNRRPVLVHCSAGCGRTGTFCTVDSVIDMLKRQRISRATASATAMDVDGQKSTTSKPAASAAPAEGDFFGSKAATTAAAGNDGDASEEDTVEGAWINRDDLDLVEKTVEDFRHQRISMVQSLQQFVLCYESIMEWLVEEKGHHHSAAAEGES